MSTESLSTGWVFAEGSGLVGRELDWGLKGCWLSQGTAVESLCCVHEQDTLSAF